MRRGTPSSKLEQVKDNIKKIHTDKLLELSRKYEEEFMNKFIGKEVEVLIETSKDGYSYGHTTNYLSVKVKGELEHNTFVNVKINSLEYPNVVGKVK